MPLTIGQQTSSSSSRLIEPLVASLLILWTEVPIARWTYLMWANTSFQYGYPGVRAQTWPDGTQWSSTLETTREIPIVNSRLILQLPCNSVQKLLSK